MSFPGQMLPSLAGCLPCFLCPSEAVFYIYKNLNASIPGRLSPVLSVPPEAVVYLYKNLNASIPGRLSPVLSVPL